jgi:hypothetical protein
VYRYVRDRVRQGVVAIKGSSRRNSPAVGKGSKVDVNWQGQGAEAWRDAVSAGD